MFIAVPLSYKEFRLISCLRKYEDLVAQFDLSNSEMDVNIALELSASAADLIAAFNMEDILDRSQEAIATALSNSI